MRVLNKDIANLESRVLQLVDDLRTSDRSSQKVDELQLTLSPLLRQLVQLKTRREMGELEAA